MRNALISNRGRRTFLAVVALTLVASAGGRAPAGVPEPFSFAADAAGKLQAERLPPPKTVAQPPAPWVAAPASVGVRFPEVIDRQLWAYPASVPSGESRPTPSELVRTRRATPTVDRPQPPEFTTALVPQQPVFSFIGRTFVAAPVADAQTPLAPTSAPFELKPVVQDDPSAPAAWRALLSPLAFVDPIPAAPERLTIPDPFDYLHRAALKTPPADALVPEVGRDRPAPIVLPTP